MIPLISVVVPVYRVPEKYLRQCIESIQNQTLKEIEILLIDDGSPDDCGGICDAYAQNDNRIIVIHQKNKGLAGARNTGVKAAQGEWVTFVDGDDWIENECLEEAYRMGLDKKSEIVIWGTVKDFDGRLIPYRYDNHFEDRKVYCEDECKYVREMLLHFNGQIATAYAKLIKREYIVKNNIYHNEDLRQGAEGLEFCMRLLEKAHRVLFINQNWYHYIYNANSISARTTEENNQYVIRCFESIREAIKEDDYLLSWFYNRLLYVIVTTAISGYFHPNNEEAYREKKRKFQNFLQMPIIAEALQTKNKKELSKQRLMLLWLIKHKMFLIVNLVAKVRYKQKIGRA